MDRRHFIKAGIGAAIVSQLPFAAAAQGTATGPTRKVGKLEKLSLRSVRIPVGIEKPFSALHVSDSHLTFADTR
ncbi:MAG: hypothetical protein IKU85_07775, partial [Bacteroidaceae bacterium]|nr:hypothetical protein [Bacteroidaceae bacterium]